MTDRRNTDPWLELDETIRAMCLRIHGHVEKAEELEAIIDRKMRDPFANRRLDNTDPDAELRQAVRQYVNAKETPGVPCQRQYHEMRHACRRAMDRHGELEARTDA